MPRVKGPLFSLEAHGTLAKAITYKRKMGGHLVEKMPFPRNKRSAAQVIQRTAFRAAADQWNALTDNQRAYYENLVRYLPLTGYNYYLRLILRGEPSPPVVEGKTYGTGIYGGFAYTGEGG